MTLKSTLILAVVFIVCIVAIGIKAKSSLQGYADRSNATSQQIADILGK